MPPTAVALISVLGLLFLVGLAADFVYFQSLASVPMFDKITEATPWHFWSFVKYREYLGGREQGYLATSVAAIALYIGMVVASTGRRRSVVFGLAAACLACTVVALAIGLSRGPDTWTYLSFGELLSIGLLVGTTTATRPTR